MDGDRDPSAADLVDPMFEAIWQAIKGWDLSRDGGPSGYAGASGTDVMTILRAVRATHSRASGGAGGEAVAYGAEFAAANGMAVTRDWVAGWNACREESARSVLAGSPAPEQGKGG